MGEHSRTEHYGVSDYPSVGKAPTRVNLCVVKCDSCWATTGYRCLGKRQPNPAITYEYEGYGFKVKEGDKKSLPIQPSGCGALLVPTEERWEGNWVVARCPEDDTHFP